MGVYKMNIEDINVLLVDDDSNVRSTIKFMLEEIGVVKIFEMDEGQSALNYFDKNSSNINIILCDWNMPKKTGIEFLREIRQTHPSMPFLMVTARGDEDSVQTCKSLDISGYILKPFTFEQLNQKVSYMIDDLLAA